MDSRRLKRILELKKRIEQAKKGDLVDAKNELDQAYAQLLNAQGEQRARLAALAGDDDISATELADRARFVVLAGNVVGAARELVAQRDREVAQREQARLEATREVRTFEVLNERDRDAQRALARTAEQRAADEIAGTRRSSS